MNTTTHRIEHEESTYALLIRSQQEDRSIPETAVYALLILTVTFSVWQTAQQRFQLPNIGLLQGTPIVQMTASTDPNI